MHYSRVGIFYFWMKRERHTLPWTTERVFLAFILKDIFYQTSPRQMRLLRDILWIIWEFLCQFCSEEKLLADICDSKIYVLY